MTVEVEQVESVQERPGGRSLAASPAESLLQGAEVGGAALIENDGFTVQDGAIQPEVESIGSDGREAVGPVMTTPSQDPNPARLDMDGQSIAIPFHVK